MTLQDYDIGLRCIKYLLCAVNFLFVLTGGIIVSIGTTIYAVYDNYSHFLDSSYFSPASLLVVVGTLIFIIAFFGFYGALRESTCMVLMFAVSLFLILFLELSAAVASYSLRDNITALINVKINQTMQQYETCPEAREAIDYLQSSLHCCGYMGPEDWSGILKEANNSDNVPTSCFNSQKEIYKIGCYRDLAFLVKRSALYVITGAIMIALLQFSGIMFACILGRSIRYHKTQREMYKWQLRSSSENEPDEPLKRTRMENLQLFI